MTIHVVSPGDTISSIASTYKISPQYIQNYNRLPNPDRLVPGQSILILTPASTYTVLPGDTLFSISASTGLTTQELLQRNPQLIIRNTLYPGETLVLTFENQTFTPIVTNSYAYPYIDRDILRSALPYLTYLTIFGYGFDLEGNLIPVEDEELIALAIQYDTQPMMLLSSITEQGNFNSNLTQALLESPDLQQTVLTNILNVIKEKGYAGLDIDFEFIPPQTAQAYIDFVQLASSILNPEGYLVHVDLAPKSSATQPGLLYEAHNYAALGAAANQVLVMTYEWGYTYGPPMAVAPLNQVRRVLEYAITEIPTEKIQMGIPNYGYDWQLPYESGRAAVSIGNMQALEIAAAYQTEILYDELAQSPYFYYTDENGTSHVVWFEDVRSITAKLNLLQELNLNGAGYWNAMRSFYPNWSLLGATFSIEKSPYSQILS